MPKRLGGWICHGLPGLESVECVHFLLWLNFTAPVDYPLFNFLFTCGVAQQSIILFGSYLRRRSWLGGGGGKWWRAIHAHVPACLQSVLLPGKHIGTRARLSLIVTASPKPQHGVLL